MLNTELYINPGTFDYGTDLVTNGGFDADTDWTKTGSEISIAGGVCSWLDTTTTNTIDQFAVVEIGKTYYIRATISNYVKGGLAVRLPSDERSDIRNTNGLQEWTVVATSTTLRLQNVDGPTTLDVDNVSVFEVNVPSESIRVDMFKDENIQITDTIQNARDIAKVFTTFSQSFTVPASKTNNKLFKHYYNPRVQSDFDARFQLPAEIRINGFNYKNGFIKLNDTKLKDNKPYSYSLIFYGELSSLTAAIKDGTLDTLDLSAYDHDYDLSTVIDGTEVGLSGTPMARNSTADIVYPLIPHTKIYEIQSAWTGTEMRDTTDGNGLEYDQLKPAIKVANIIDAIETKYGITFSTDFFGDTDFSLLYMWLCRNSGPVVSSGKSYTKFDICDLTWDAVDSDDIGNLFTCGRVYTNKFPDGAETQWTYTIEITSFTGTGNYTLYFYDVESQKTRLFQVYDDETTGGGPYSYDFIQEEVGGGQTWFTPIISISSDAGITSMDHEVTVERRIYTTGGVLDSTETSTYTATIVPVAGSIQVSEQIPAMKTMEFLTGIFKMWNLTAYVKDDGDIYVDTLDNFYALGSDIDITEYVDISDSVVSPPVPYSELVFKYTKTNLISANEFFELFGKEWGSESYLLNPDYGNFGEGKYDITVPFGHIMFDRLVDAGDGSETFMSFGWCIDKDLNPVQPEAPILFYLEDSPTIIGGNNLIWSDATDSATYRRASNVSGTFDTNYYTLHYGAENDEYTLTTNENSLYKRVYETYVTDTYGGGARIVKVTAYLPPKVILTYNLYDRIIINGQSHKINSIQIDLIDGKTELELITE